MSADLTQELIKTVLAVATPIILGYVLALLHRLVKKAGFTLSAENEARLEKAAYDAIYHAEEWAAARIKARIDTTAADKLEHAIATMTAKVPGLTADEAAALVHQNLPKLQLGAAGFLQGLRRAATSDQPAAAPSAR